MSATAAIASHIVQLIAPPTSTPPNVLANATPIGVSPNSGPDSLDSYKGFQLAISVMAFYLTGLVSVLGIIGNALSFVVLQRASQPRRCPLFTILSALCLVDAVFILANFLINVLGVFYEYHQVGSRWLYWLYLTRGFTVKYVMPVCFTMQMASIYITLLVSFERYNAVCRPLAVIRGANDEPPSSKSVIRNIGLVLLFSAAYNAPKYFELVVVARPVGSELPSLEQQRKILEKSLSLFGCYHSSNETGTVGHCEPYKYTYEPAAWLLDNNGTATGLYEVVYTGIMYSVVYFVAPVAAITATNIRIAVCLRRNIKAWRSAGRNQYKEVQLTYVSLAIVISFYLFMLPNVILTAVDVLGSSALGERHAAQLAIVVTNFLVLINSCLNFVLYCVIGKKFRDCLRELLCGWRARGPLQHRRPLLTSQMAQPDSHPEETLELQPLSLDH